MSENHDHQIAIHALTLLGALVESHADNGIATPPMYQALDVAIQMAEHLEGEDAEELVNLLKFTQIQCGEIIEQLQEKLEKLSQLVEQARETDTLAEFVKNLTENEN